jgi:hypothetical protein
MSGNHYLGAVRVHRVVWRNRAGILHATAPRFQQEAQARRFARLLRNNPAVVETRVTPLVRWPVLPPPDAG